VAPPFADGWRAIPPPGALGWLPVLAAAVFALVVLGLVAWSSVVPLARRLPPPAPRPSSVPLPPPAALPPPAPGPPSAQRPEGRR
jgi:hypothetical protein